MKTYCRIRKDLQAEGVNIGATLRKSWLMRVIMKCPKISDSWKWEEAYSIDFEFED